MRFIEVLDVRMSILLGDLTLQGRRGCGYDRGVGKNWLHAMLKIEFEGALLIMRVNGRVLFGRRRWRRFVELAGYPGVELLSALAPDVCGDDNVVFFPSQGPCESPPPTPPNP